MSQGACPLSKEFSTSDILVGWAQQITFHLHLTHTDMRQTISTSVHHVEENSPERGTFPRAQDLSSSFAGES